MRMNKKVLALALAAFVATGTVTISAANDNDTQKTCTEQTKCNKADKKGKKDGKKCHHGRKNHKGHKGHFNLFRGVELTAEQQTAIKTVREKQQAEEQAAREKSRESFMNELKGILTPEQYQQVEQNATKMKEARAMRMDKNGKAEKGQRGEGRHHQRDGKKAEQRTPRS